MYSFNHVSCYSTVLSVKYPDHGILTYYKNMIFLVLSIQLGLLIKGVATRRFIFLLHLVCHVFILSFVVGASFCLSGLSYWPATRLFSNHVINNSLYYYYYYY